MLDNLNDIVSKSNTKSFHTPSNIIHILTLDDMRLFYKLSKVSSMPLSKIIHLSSNKIKYSFTPVTFKSADQSKSFEKENSTLYKWHISGIKCIKPIDFSDEGIVFPFVDLPTVESKLNESKDISIFKKTIDSYFSIREEAFKNDDPGMFHSDCHLRNFLVDDDSSVIPIDPGACVSKRFSTLELDTHLNLYFMYNIFRLNDRDFAKNLALEFNSSLSPKNRQNMSRINYPISPLIASYLFLKEIVLPYATGSKPRENNTFKAYSPRNHAFIQSILK